MKRNNSVDLIGIGLRIRQIRKTRGLTLECVARRTGLSKGLLSKIENFRAIPSLPVLLSIARSLNVDMADLVRQLNSETVTPYALVKAGNRMPVERDDAVGFHYESLTTKAVGGLVFESFVLTLAPKAKRKSVTTEGHEFLYLLKGRVGFMIGKEEVLLAPGDALFFDGRLPHVPRNRGKGDAEMLVVYLIEKGRDG